MRRGIIAATLLLTFVLAPASGASKGYYRLFVPGQVVTGYWDEGTGIGKIAPYKLIATGGRVTGHYTWKKLSTSPASMPDLRIDRTTGVVYGSGPHIAQGKHQLKASVTDSAGRKVTFTASVEIVHCDSTAGLEGFQPCPEIVFTEYNSNRSAYVPKGKVGYDYAVALYIVGGLPPYSFVRSQGSLPPGLKLIKTFGVITGVPTKSGSFPFRITVIDGNGESTRMDARIVITR